MISPIKRANPLTEGRIAPALFFFALPILGSNVLQSLNGSVNSIWVGHYLGEAALTATSNANTILFFLLALCSAWEWPPRSWSARASVRRTSTRRSAWSATARCSLWAARSRSR